MSKRYARTMISGALLAPNLVLLACSLDEVVESGSGELSVVDSYAPGIPNPDDGTVWWTQPYDGHTLVSIEVWTEFILRAVVSMNGFVRLYGPRGNPSYTYQIPQAGVFGDKAAGYGYVSRIRAIGDGLYVCGDHRQFYRFNWDGRNLAAGHWTDMAGPMRQPPVSADAPADDADFDAWLDTQGDSVEFRDLHGSASDDIYSVGDEAWHFDGRQWQRLALPTDESLNAVIVLNADHVVMVGHNGTVLIGNAREGFRDVSGVDDNQNFTGVAYFQERLWLASNMGLFVYDSRTPGARIEPYRTDLEVDLVDTHQLEAKDGVLWSFGYKDLAYLDTREAEPHWVRVHHPDNPRVDALGKKARRRNATTSAASSVLPDWLPPKPRRGIDIGAVMRLVGYRAVGAELAALLRIQPQTLVEARGGDSGNELVLQEQGLVLMLRSDSETRAAVESVGLAGVRLVFTAASRWKGDCPAGIEPNSTDPGQWRKALQQVLGEPDYDSRHAVTYFTGDGRGAGWALSAQCDAQGRLQSVQLIAMGGLADRPATS